MGNIRLWHANVPVVCDEDDDDGYDDDDNAE